MTIINNDQTMGDPSARQAGQTFMLLDRGVGSDSPAVRTVRRGGYEALYWSICTKMTSEQAARGECEREMRKMGLDKHFNKNFVNAWKGTRCVQNLEQFYQSITQKEASEAVVEIDDADQRLHIRGLTNQDEAEQRKVVGWFRRSESGLSMRGESGCGDMWRAAKEFGVDTKSWKSMMWSDSHGASFSHRRLEILCETREHANRSLKELRTKLGEQLQMEFFLGRTYDHRCRARATRERIISTPMLNVQPNRRAQILQTPNNAVTIENPYECLTQMDDMDAFLHGESSSEVREADEREEMLGAVFATSTRSSRLVEGESESMAGEEHELNMSTLSELGGTIGAQIPALPLLMQQNDVEDVNNENRVMRRSKLVVGAWNSNGLRARSAAEIVEALRTIDIIGITETGCTEHNMVRLPGFHHVGDAKGTERMADTPAAHASRGISIYYKASSQLCINRVEVENCPDAVWIRIRPRRGSNIVMGCFYALQATDAKCKMTYERLSEIVAGFIESGNKIILMGDFNARTGLGAREMGREKWKNHDRVANESGKRLIDLVERNGLEFLDLPKSEDPWTRRSGDSQSTIDYILASPQLVMHDGGRRVKTFNAGSDHRAVVAMVRTQVDLEARAGPVEMRPNFEKLRDGPMETEDEDSNPRREIVQLRNKFAAEIQKNLGDWVERCNAMEFPSRDDVDKMFEEWSEAVRRAGREVLGERKIGGKKRMKNHRWWTPRLSKLSKERQKMHDNLVKRGRRERGGMVKTEEWKKYVDFRSMVKAEVDAAKAEGWVDLMMQIVAARKKPSKKRMWGLIMQTVKKPLTQADPTQVIGDDGRLTSSVEEALKEWKAHFQRVANPPAGDFDEEFKQAVDQETEERRALADLDNSVLSVDADLCEAAIKDIPVGASPGANGIGNAALKYGGGHRVTPMEKPPTEEEKEEAVTRQQTFAKGIAALCNMVGRAKEIPRVWDDARQVPIPKSVAAEDPTNRDNFRGVTLRDATGKLASKIFISKYFDKKYEEMMCPEQGGFRRGRRCAHQLFSLVDTVQRANTEKKALYILFVDFRKAYPSVWRNGMFKKMAAEADIMPAFVAMMEKFAGGGNTRIYLQGQESEAYTAEVGVQEGATESPKLFNVHINDLPQALRNGGDRYAGNHDEGRNCGKPGVFYAADFIAALFADDLAIGNETLEGLQTCLDALDEFCKKWRMTVSMGKTKVMRCGMAAKWPAPVKYRGEFVEVVDHYKYLGVWVQSNGRWNREFDQRMQAAVGAQRSVSPFLANNNTPVRLRAQVWTALVRSRIEYGCEIVVYNGEQKMKWERLQNKAAAMILGCNTRTASDAMKGELGWHSLAVRADRYRVRLIHEISQSDLLPMAKKIWALKGKKEYSAWPLHTMRREFWRMDNDHGKIFGVASQIAYCHVNFKKAGEAGWRWAREVIEQKARMEWKNRLSAMVEECEGRHSVSQVSLYNEIKYGWGWPTYTQSTGAWTRVVARVRIGTLPVGAFQGKVKQGKGMLCAQCKATGVEREETIAHFAWECEAGTNKRRREIARELVLHTIVNCAEIKLKYQDHLDTRTVEDTEREFKALVLGTGVEYVYPRAFPENPKQVGGRSYSERRALNKMNGFIAGISKTLFGEMWEVRNQKLTEILEGVQEERDSAPPAPVQFNVAEDFIPLPGDIGNSVRQARAGNRLGAGAARNIRRSDQARSLQQDGIRSYFSSVDAVFDRGHVEDMPGD